jgi:hypothetical protein
MDLIMEDLGLNVDNSKLKALFKSVRSNKIQARVLTRDPGYIYQADLLQLPKDGEYNYCLTVVDTNNNKCDAVALKGKTAEETLNGFKTIFNRKPLEYPKFSLETDQGKEFNNEILKKYLNDHNIFIRLGARGRSDQQAVVEFTQGIIAQLLFLKMNVDEIETNETSREWVEELPKVIKSINKHLSKDKKELIERDVLENNNEEIIPIGTKVRVALDKPVSMIEGKKLYGKFRKTDHRWDKIIRTIKDISIRPNQPIMYFIEGKPRNVFTRNQVQVVNENEKLPQARKYIVEKLLKKFYKGRVPYFEVKWENYDETTNEPRSKLFKDIPDKVKEFEKEERQKQLNK